MSAGANDGTDSGRRAAQAGWLDDGSGRVRYWDGSAWTERFADEHRAAQPAEASEPYILPLYAPTAER